MFLKGERCYSDKCSCERRAFGPGQHGQNRFRKSRESGRWYPSRCPRLA
ncbi:MAG: hypothetical protein CSA32_05075 [Desulfobulbus propionicus]|nr:MAG: hypothetical protein CSA32_05075 [Desulfobulbus propionicus]